MIDSCPRVRWAPTRRKALRGVVGAMDVQPVAFDSLADDDEGHDPNKLETALLRDRFDRHEIYLSLAAELKRISKRKRCDPGQDRPGAGTSPA